MSTALTNQHNGAFYSNTEEKGLHIRVKILFWVAYLPNTTARRWGYDATVTLTLVVAPSVVLHQRSGYTHGAREFVYVHATRWEGGLCGTPAVTPAGGDRCAPC